MQREYKLSVVGTRFSENELITANYKYRILRNNKEINIPFSECNLFSDN